MATEEPLRLVLVRGWLPTSRCPLAVMRGLATKQPPSLGGDERVATKQPLLLVVMSGQLLLLLLHSNRGNFQMKPYQGSSFYKPCWRARRSRIAWQRASDKETPCGMVRCIMPGGLMASVGLGRTASTSHHWRASSCLSAGRSADCSLTYFLTRGHTGHSS